MKPQNILFIMSDEHNIKHMGCSGHPMTQTPNLMRLPPAARSLLLPTHPLPFVCRPELPLPLDAIPTKFEIGAMVRRIPVR